MIKSKQVNKLLLARMVLTAMAVPVSGSAADHILVDPTSDVKLLAAVTGNAYDGTDLPVTEATATAEGWVGGDVVELLNSANSEPVSFEDNELYARLVQDGANLKFNFFTNVEGVETAASIDADTVGVADLDVIFSYKYKFANLPEDAITRAKRTYVGDDPAGGGTDLVPYVEYVTIVTQDTLPQPSVEVGAVVVGDTNTYEVKVFVNGVYESGVTYDQPTNTLTWDANALGYTLMTDDVVTYEYLATVATLAAAGPTPLFSLNSGDLAPASIFHASQTGTTVTAVPTGFLFDANGSGFNSSSKVRIITGDTGLPNGDYVFEMDFDSFTGAGAGGYYEVPGDPTQHPITGSGTISHTITKSSDSDQILIALKGSEVNSFIFTGARFYAV